MAIVNLDFVDLVAYTDSQTTTRVIGRATTNWRSGSQVRAEPIKLYAVNENYRVKQGEATFRLQSQLNADYDPHVRFFVQALLLTANSAERRSLVASSNLVCNNNIIVGKKSFVEIDIGALGINWAPDTEYRFEFSDDFVRDQGVDDVETAAAGFTLDYTSNPPVAIENSNPEILDDNVKNNTFIEIEFDRQIRPNFAGGNIYLYEDPDTLVSTYNIKQDVQFIGFEKIKFSTLGKLKSNTTYYLLTDEGVIKDYDNLSFDLTDENTFRFTTSLFEFPELISFKFVDAQLVLDYIRYRNYSSDLNVSVDADFIPSYFKGIVNEIYPVVTDQQTDAVKTARTVKTFDVNADIVPAATYVANGRGSYQSRSTILGRMTYNRGGLARQFNVSANIAPNARKIARITRTLNAVATVNSRTTATYRPTPFLSSNFRIPEAYEGNGYELTSFYVFNPLEQPNLLSNSRIRKEVDVNINRMAYVIRGRAGSSTNQLVITSNTRSDNRARVFIINMPYVAPTTPSSGPEAEDTGPLNASTINFVRKVVMNANHIMVSVQITPSRYGRIFVYEAFSGNLITTISKDFEGAFNLNNNNFGNELDNSNNYVITSGNFPGDEVFSVQTPSGGGFITQYYQLINYFVDVYNIITGQLVRRILLDYTEFTSLYDKDFSSTGVYPSNTADGSTPQVTISGDIAVVSIIDRDQISPNEFGVASVKFYAYNVLTGQLLYTKTEPIGFRYTMRADENYLVIATSGLSTPSNSEANVKVYNIFTGELITTIEKPLENNTDFAQSIDISEKRIAVSARNRAYIYDVLGRLENTIIPSRTSYRFIDPFVRENRIFSPIYFEFVRLDGSKLLMGGVNLVDIGSRLRVLISAKSSLAVNNFRIRRTNSILSSKFNISTGPIIRTTATLSSSFNVNFDTNITPSNLRNFDFSRSLIATNDENFGHSVAINSNVIAAGAPYWRRTVGSTNYNNTGRIAIMDHSLSSSFTIIENPIQALDGQDDSFGFSVALTEDTLIVGAKFTSVGGSVYIYNLANNQLTATINNPNLSGGIFDGFGDTLAVSGNNLIVASNEGVHVYNLLTQQLLRTLTFIVNGNNVLPRSTSIDGNIAIIGAPDADPTGTGGGTNSGRAFIMNVSTGQLIHELINPTPTNSGAGDRFGVSVAIKGNFAAVAAETEDIPGSNSGTVYVYNVATGQLRYTIHNPNFNQIFGGTSAEDRFGRAVTISDNYLIVSAPFEDSATQNSIGHVYVFDLATGSLLRNLNSDISNNANHSIGQSLAAYGDKLVVGGPETDTTSSANQGRVYVWSGTT